MSADAGRPVSADGLRVDGPAGKVTHVETETRQRWQYGDLPGKPTSSRAE